MQELDGTYKLDGTEDKKETLEKIPCGEMVTTQYFKDGELVRQDKVANIDKGLMSKAFKGLDIQK